MKVAKPVQDYIDSKRYLEWECGYQKAVLKAYQKCDAALDLIRATGHAWIEEIPNPFDLIPADTETPRPKPGQ